MITFYFVRHGQTLFNIIERVQGWCDSPLTQVGIKQAKSLQKKIQSLPITHGYSSSSERAIDTLRYILEGTNIPCESRKGFKEIYFGTLEGGKDQEVFIEGRDLSKGYKDFEGETFEECRDRFLNTLDELMQKHDGDTLLIVSHAGVLKEVLAHFMPEKDWTGPGYKLVPNCSVSKVIYDQGIFTVEECCSVEYMDDSLLK